MTLSLSPGTLFRYAWLVALFAIIPGVAVYLVTSSLPKGYTSEARILVGSLTSADLQEQLGYQQLARTYANLATTPLVLDPVADALHLDEPIAELGQRVDAFAPVDESFVVITGTARSAAEAARLTQGVADALVRLATEPPTGVTGAGQPGVALARVVQPAVEADEPSAPSVLFDTLIATVVGLGLGLLIAMVLATRVDGRRREPRSDMPPDARAFPAGPYTR